MDRPRGFVCREDSFQKRERQRHLHSLCSSTKIPVTLFFFFSMSQFLANVSTIQIKRNTTLTTIKQLNLQESLCLYEMKFRNHTVNDGDQETSGTSFNRLTTCLKQRNHLLTFSLQNLHTTEYTGKSFQVSSTMQRFPCRCSRSHKKYRLAIVLYPCLCRLLLILA